MIKAGARQFYGFWLCASGALQANRPLFLCARLCVGAFILLTVGYCLLAYIPFSYQWILNGSIAPWVRTFGRWHTALYWPVFLLCLATTAPDASRPKTRRLVLGFLITGVGAGIWLAFRPLLRDLRNDEASLVWSLISLLPLLWLAAIDYAGGYGDWRARRNDDALRFTAFAAWGGFISALYTAVFFLRSPEGGGGQFRTGERAFALCWGVLSHLLLVVILYSALRLIRATANRFRQATKVEFFLCNVFATLLAGLTLRYIVFAAVSFTGKAATLFSIAVSLSAAAFISGTTVKAARPRLDDYESGLSLTLLPLLAFLPKGKTRLPALMICLVTLCGLAYLIPAMIAVTDWVFLIQRLSVLAVWVLSFACFYATSRPSRKRQYPLATVLILASLCFVSYRALYLSRHNLPMILNQDSLEVDAALGRYSDREISFKVARAILHPNISLFPTAQTADGSTVPAKVFDDAFHQFLSDSTNLPESAPVEAVDVRLVEKFVPNKDHKPNIFIFVVDSLRQDYVSPYNSAARFTPNLAKFAADSVVMRNGFTRYNGTALAEPSLWVGGMVLHMQYTQPFYPMNSLQKLINREGYESIMTVDPVLKVILDPSSPVEELDAGKDWADYDLCQSLSELESKISARADTSKPLFVYSQSQDLHVTRRTSGHRFRPPTDKHPDHPDFDNYCVNRIKAIDECFGRFLDVLKSQGMYEDSIIVFTSDHGDNLGEGGRWGHGTYIHPELIRIPLIIHLPKWLLSGKFWNAKDVAFSADITPSLFYLLGHRPIIRNQVFGRPLFTDTKQEYELYVRDHYLIGSSYAPIYGILDKTGRTLFITDVVSGRDGLYDITADPLCERNLINEATKASYRSLVYEGVSEINRFYGYNAGQ